MLLHLPPQGVAGDTEILGCAGAVSAMAGEGLTNGGGFGRIFKISKQPVNAQVQGFYNVVKPDGSEDWSLRLQFTFLFPK